MHIFIYVTCTKVKLCALHIANLNSSFSPAYTTPRTSMVPPATSEAIHNNRTRSKN